MKRFFPVLFIALVVVIFFWRFFINGLLPIPGDTIVGLYHPFRDLYAKEYPNGIPFKNFLITDPVRQQYPWRELAISMVKKLEIPLWNPYNFSGTPLLANLQSAPFYFLNILFFIFPFVLSWSLLVILGQLLGGVFLFLYLDNLKLNKWASVLGAVSFSFSGFFVAWMEWGTVTHVVLWLPLMLLSIDRLFFYSNIDNPKPKSQNSKIQLKSKNLIIWSLIFIFSLCSSFFAGHLQTFFYLFVLILAYFGARWLQFGKSKKILFLFLILNSLFAILTFVQWFPTLQFILLSARGVDQSPFNNPGWFIPWEHLIQFIIPDFFGNPTTLNYWGTWNYAEFVGYVGIFPLIMAIYALFVRKDKKTLFFGTFFFLALIFALPTFLAKIPYSINLPFLATAQPTRLLVIIDFALAVLAALGLDYVFRHKAKTIFYPLGFIGVVLLGAWTLTMFGNQPLQLATSENISIIKRNLVLPSSIFIIVGIMLVFLTFFNRIAKRIVIVVYSIIIVITIFDVFRFGWKFTPFTKQEYLFPNTKVISFLKANIEDFRYMTTDSRILPPNFSSIYRIQSVDGYDPLYLLRYAELIAASERGNGKIDPPFGFNRIITPHNYDSKIIDLLGVKYVLSLSELESLKLNKVFQEGETRIYQNKNVMPRAYFVSKTVNVENKKEAIKMMLNESFDPKDTAIIERENLHLREIRDFSIGKAEIKYYSENKIIINTENVKDGFLVLGDSFYPSWNANVDGIDTKIYRTNYNFRGIFVSGGKHIVEFYAKLL
ncbi:MAG: hypothetical protein HYT07_02110 [Candidatus Levybacteria bacterium]|nr:hypothetical protein [Candidatus Levybacteria bacterium]